MFDREFAVDLCGDAGADKNKHQRFLIGKELLNSALNICLGRPHGQSGLAGYVHVAAKDI